MLPANTRRRLPVLSEGRSRLTHRRLREPTRLPAAPRRGLWARYLARLSWLFG